MRNCISKRTNVGNWFYKDDAKLNQVAAGLSIWHRREFLRNHLNKKEDRWCGRK